MNAIVSRFSVALVLLAIIALIATKSMFSASPVVIAAQVVAVGLSVWARRSFPPGAFRVAANPGSDSLVRRGPYRVIRHPMYSAALLLVWSAILGHWTLANAGIGVAVTLILVARVVGEERLLRERYPEYPAYARSTKALVPYIL